jgi:chromosomal replication initiator protein
MKILLPPDHPACPSIQDIIKEVAAKHHLSYVDMVSQRRQARLVRARQEAYWRCIKETPASLPMIGRYFGDRDHTTILKGARVHEARLSVATG